METREGDLRQLDLFESTVVGAGRVPWEGRSPRALTRGRKRFIFEAQAWKSVGEAVDPEQYDLWLPIKKAPRIYRGAPLLLPLKEDDHG